MCLRKKRKKKRVSITCLNIENAKGDLNLYSKSYFYINIHLYTNGKGGVD